MTTVIPPNEWVSTGTKLTDSALLDQLRTVIEDVSSVVVEHRHYYGACDATRLIFSDSDKLMQYFKDHVRAGDKFYFWVYEQCCRVDNMLATAKMPDEQGLIPTGGSY